MKLVLFFIAMDLFTVLAYPFVLIHSKLLRQFSKSRKNVNPANLLATSPATLGRRQIEIV